VPASSLAGISLQLVNDLPRATAGTRQVGQGRLNRPATSYELIDNRNDSQHDKNMDKPAGHVENGEAQNPEYKKNYCYCPDHDGNSLSKHIPDPTTQELERFHPDNPGAMIYRQMMPLRPTIEYAACLAFEAEIGRPPLVIEQ
jgi:hypothetical protein